MLEYFFRGRLDVKTTPLETVENSPFGEECLLTFTNKTTTRESFKGINYMEALIQKTRAMSQEELRDAGAGKLKALGRELRN